MDANQDFTDGPTLLQSLLSIDFEGMSGRVQFDENGDRKGAYVISPSLLSLSSHSLISNCQQQIVFHSQLDEYIVIWVLACRVLELS